MTIYQIGILTYYFCRVNDHPHAGQLSPPIAMDEFRRLSRLGLLEPATDGERHFALTAKGYAYVEGLQQVPLPRRVEKWVIDWPGDKG